MKSILISIFCALVCLTVLAKSKTPEEFLTVGIKSDATANDIALVKTMINENIDPQYDFETMGVLYLKKGPPGNYYLLGTWNVIGRGFSFHTEQAEAWVALHQAEFDDYKDVSILKKFTPNWEKQ